LGPHRLALFGLLEGRVRLVKRHLRDLYLVTGRYGVVVGLDDVQGQLCGCAGDAKFGTPPAGIRSPPLTDDPAPGEDALGEREPEVVGVLLAERQLVPAAAAATAAVVPPEAEAFELGPEQPVEARRRIELRVEIGLGPVLFATGTKHGGLGDLQVLTGGHGPVERVFE
jgi:hypothetical protein